jgi:hypothetical protein
MWISVRSRADGALGSLEGMSPMRWTDLPPDSGPADGRASALPRGEWEELRRRLERLPEGHPSRPDDDADPTAVEELAGEDAADKDLAEGRGGLPERREPSDSGRPDSGRAPPGEAKPLDAQRRVQGSRSADAGHAKPGGLGELSGHGEREPYRPWFTGGESPEPWFTAEPDQTGEPD